jgi:hypothetical protein
MQTWEREGHGHDQVRVVSRGYGGRQRDDADSKVNGKSWKEIGASGGQGGTIAPAFRSGHIS